MPELSSNSDELGNDVSTCPDTAASLTSAQSLCRSLVPSGGRTIALFPPSAQRNVHPTASTSHLHPPITVHPPQSFGLAGISSCVRTWTHEPLPFPATFQQLQNNTDLRLAPSVAPQYHLPSHRPHFTSFQMAHKHVEFLQEVDVVSDAENIKELLKMPFNPKAEVSLLVHRVGRTLLLDPFSVQLLEQHRSDWSWLHRFQNMVFQKLRKGDPRSAVTKHHADAQQSKWQMLTRFLQYTLMAQQQQQRQQQAAAAAASSTVSSSSSPKLSGLTGAVTQDKKAQPRPLPPPAQSKGAKWDKLTEKRKGRKQATNGDSRKETTDTAVIPVSMTTAVQDRAQMLSAVDDAMPEPDASDQVPDETSEAHARNIIWNFENLRMLIGTDLPIFGGDTRPCVSLRLTDMAKPINVLTGLDYWLDNLMCNVPEVAMCFHLAGIVQKYERIKTEELPELRDSTFSPGLVKDIAKNILTFLKDNTTHEGHTYWLFKREGDDVVKLYDLTSLGLEEEAGGGQEDSIPRAPVGDGSPGSASNVNPFTVPAGMLFYRVAKNLLSDPTARNKAATISQLLHNSIKLLDPGRFPEIVSSAHYHIADILMAGDSEIKDFESESSGEDFEDVPTQPGQMVFKTTAQKKNDNGKTGHAVGTASTSDANKNKKKQKKQKKRPVRQPAGRGDEGGHSAGPAPASGEGTPTDQQPSITLSTLSLPNTRGTFPRSSHSYRPPKLTNDFHKRCWISVSHVVKGLSCLLTRKSIPVDAESQQQDASRRTELPSDEPQMAKSYESIPLPYESLSKKTTSDTQPHSTTAEPSAESSQDSSLIVSDRSLVVPSNNGSDCDIGEAASTAESGTLAGTTPSSVCSVVWAEGGSEGMPGEQSVVPSSPCVNVNLSSVKYDVSSQASKLKVMLLHKSAIVYKVLADNAVRQKKYAVATENIELCVRCCYAVGLELGVTSVFDATPLPGSCYPSLNEALTEAANIMYLTSRYRSTGPPRNDSNDGGQANNSSGDTTTECHCCSSDPCSDNSRMNEFLNDMMPPLYRSQFELPLTPQDKYSCMEMAQLYLILALGGKVQASKSREGSTTKQTPSDGGENDPSRCASGGGDSDASVHAWLASSLNADLDISEEKLNKNPDVLMRLAAIMNEMACDRINQAQADCLANSGSSGAVLEALAPERGRLELAAYFFGQLGSQYNVAVAHTNLAKYHRVVSCFMPERFHGDCYGAAEDEHYKMAVDSYRSALRILDDRAEAQDLKQQQEHQLTKRQRKRPTKPSRKTGKRGIVGGDGSPPQQQHRVAPSVDNDEFRNTILMNEATTLLQQATMIMARPPLTKEGDPKLSSALSVVQQCYVNLQCMPQGVNTEKCIAKSVECCDMLATLYCSPNPPGGGQRDVTASVSWREKHCLLLASTSKYREALQTVIDDCARLLDREQQTESASGDGEVLALQSLRLLVHSHYLVIGVKRPYKEILLDCLKHLRDGLKWLCQLITAANASGSPSLVSLDAAKKAFIEALQMKTDEHCLGQRLAALLQSVGRHLGIDSAAGPTLQL